MKDIRRESRVLKEIVAEQTLDLRLLTKCPWVKKHDRQWGRRNMRYPASEKLEIIRTVEKSHLSARQTLDKIGVPRPTFYRWYDKYLEGGLARWLTSPRAHPMCGTVFQIRLELKSLTSPLKSLSYRRVNQQWQTDFTYFRIVG